MNDLSYRKLLCAVIHQAVNYATGRCLSEIISDTDKYKTLHSQQEKDAAIAYINSDQFEHVCELLSIDHEVEAIRKLVSEQTYNPAFVYMTAEKKNLIAEEYRAGGITQKELGERHGVTDRYVRKLVRMTA